LVHLTFKTNYHLVQWLLSCVLCCLLQGRPKKMCVHIHMLSFGYFYVTVYHNKAAMSTAVSCIIIQVWFMLIPSDGSYNFKQTKFKDFSWTFQGQKLVFKDSVLFTKLTFLVPLLTLKTLNSVITYLRYVNSSTMVDDISLWNDILESEVQK